MFPHQQTPTTSARRRNRRWSWCWRFSPKNPNRLRPAQLWVQTPAHPPSLSPAPLLSCVVTLMQQRCLITLFVVSWNVFTAAADAGCVLMSWQKYNSWCFRFCYWGWDCQLVSLEAKVNKNPQHIILSRRSFRAEYWGDSEKLILWRAITRDMGGVNPCVVFVPCLNCSPSKHKTSSSDDVWHLLTNFLISHDD